MRSLASPAAAAEEQLLQQPTLENFETLEKLKPAPPDLLYTAEGVTSVQGRWLLTKTIAAKVGRDVTSESAVDGAVNASGLVINTSEERLPVQEIDTANMRIGNEIAFDALGQSIVVRVAGSFLPDASNGRRAIVNFDTLDVFLLGSTSRRALRAGWLFSLVRSLKPDLASGDSYAPWLDTTYISQKVRLGRGNKGSIFVLQKQAGDGPLTQWPL